MVEWQQKALQGAEECEKFLILLLLAYRSSPRPQPFNDPLIDNLLTMLTLRWSRLLLTASAWRVTFSSLSQCVVSEIFGQLNAECSAVEVEKFGSQALRDLPGMKALAITGTRHHMPTRPALKPHELHEYQVLML
jgi:hypothetical protein